LIREQLHHGRVTRLLRQQRSQQRSEIHCLDVHELPPEAWESILNASVFPFPIVTFKEDGVWRAFNAEKIRSADGWRGGRNSCSESGRRSATFVLIDNKVVAGLFAAGHSF
jgi:hypothetical protein